jgi:hypothetical protein
VLVEKVADDDDDVVENEEEEDDRLKVDEIEARRADRFKIKEGRRKTGILWIMDE